MFTFFYVGCACSINVYNTIQQGAELVVKNIVVGNTKYTNELLSNIINLNLKTWLKLINVLLIIKLVLLNEFITNVTNVECLFVSNQLNSTQLNVIIRS